MKLMVISVVSLCLNVNTGGNKYPLFKGEGASSALASASSPTEIMGKKLAVQNSITAYLKTARIPFRSRPKFTIP